MTSKEKIEKLLTSADITLNGNESWDITVHNKRFYNRVLGGGTLALGETYMDGWWDVQDLDQFIDRALSARLDEKLITFGLLFHIFKAKVLNLQSANRAFHIGKAHYDIGNELYHMMLDPRMVYTCGYWSGNPSALDLAVAQEAKLDLVCKKIDLKSGQRVLDIGGGWGSFGKYAAEHYGANVVAVTVSKEQAVLGRELTQGLPVEIRLQDYRDINDGPYDHVVSLGMFEHVGYKNYSVYMETVYRLLKDDGLFLLHTIGSNKTSYVGDPWMGKYIFPGGMTPSVSQIGKSVEDLFVMEDWHNFGADYDKTLMVWFSNFDRNWSKLKNAYDERFYRMWKFYLLTSAASFRSRKNQLWQIVLSKHGKKGGYKSVR